MRFPQAWADISKQNSVLRVAILAVASSGVLALLIALKFAFKDPLIIERGCFSRPTSSTALQEPTKTEVEGFLREALTQRFDSESVVQGDLISLEELGNRSIEQEEMKRRGVRQNVVVRSIQEKDGAYLVDSDRVLAVGGLRSALAFPLLVKLQRASRSQSNPYGLVLFKVSAQATNERGKNESK